MSLNNILNEIWRLTPSSFAEKVSGGKFKRYPHIEHVSQIIAREVYRGGARIIVSMPPRHGKSFLISTYTPPWFLSHFPDKNVILCSYEADFAAMWGRQVRNIIREHSQMIGLRLTDDSQAADRWNTTEGGGMITAGVGGPITGRGGHLIIVDDPVKNAEQAHSEVYRKKTIEWFNSTLYTRLEPNANLIILMTRWHEDDLAGHLLREHGE